jgi:hypothetical protein
MNIVLILLFRGPYRDICGWCIVFHKRLNIYKSIESFKAIHDAIKACLLCVFS